MIRNMMDKYDAQDRGVRIIELDGSFQMCTKPEMYEYLIRVAKQPRRYVLTDVQLETLSIIAYRQPVTKLEIEKIRGVKSDHAVKQAGGVRPGVRGGQVGRPGQADPLRHDGGVPAPVRHPLSGGSAGHQSGAD